MTTMDRRKFLATAGAAAIGCTAAAGETEGPAVAPRPEDGFGCLVDTTLCIGCRECAKACGAANGLTGPRDWTDDRDRQPCPVRPNANAFTVVNRYDGCPSLDQTHRRHTYVKIQCMHCLEPACVSACIVGALQRRESGAITYDPDKCIGCRYCMVACPFQIPAYEYGEALAPRIRKCTFCFDSRVSRGEPPACAQACPREAILFGRRGALLDAAHERIRRRPDRYLDHVYGEHEAGGTAWLYLTGRDFTELGLLALPGQPVPRLTEAIQHGIFKYFAPPALLYALLAGTMWWSHRRRDPNVTGHDSGEMTP